MPTLPHRLLPFAVLLTTIALLAPTPAGGVPPPPPQGVYEGCAPGADGGVEACAERLAAIRAGGFRYVLDYSAWYGSTADVLRYAEAAEALGLKLIWPLNNPAWRGLGSLAATYSGLGLGEAEFAERAIELVADEPATWGFYVGDELPAGEAGRVRELGALVRRLAPGKGMLYVARPGVEKLAPFAPSADLIGADAYPIGSHDPSVARTARSVRTVASTTGTKTAMVLQAFSWSQYRPDSPPTPFPGARAMRAMRDAAIRHADPAMILWYSYPDVLRSPDPERRWRALVEAAFDQVNRHESLGPTS